MHKHRWIYPTALVAAFLLPLILYLKTLARSVGFVDAGELAAAAATLGVAHPPGYPLFTLLGRLASWLPIGSSFSRIALLSALSTAATAGVLFWVAGEAWGPRRGSSGWPRVVAGLAGAALFAVADTPWSQAVDVEVYALHGLLVAVCLASCLLAAEGSPRLPIALPAFLAGLGLAHHLTAAAILPSVAIVIRRARPRALLLCVAAAVAPLLLYIYLPIRSAAGAAVNWDYPDTWERFRLHVSAAQYQPWIRWRGLNLDELRTFFLVQLPRESSILMPPLALAGAVLLWRTRPRWLLLTGLPALAFVLYNALYGIQDIGVYYIPVIWILCLWATVALVWVGERIETRKPALRITFAAGCVALVAWPLARNFAPNDSSGRDTASIYARDVLRYAEQNAVIFSDDPYHFSQPMIFLQEVEQIRPDVVVLDVRRLKSPMVERNLDAWCPDLAGACRAEARAYSGYASRAVRGLPYDREACDRAHAALLSALAHEAARRRPTYSLIGGVNHPMFRGLSWSPEGLLVRLTEEDVYRELPAPAFDLPARLRGRAISEDEAALLAQYARMVDGRLWYLEKHGHAAEAGPLRDLRRTLGGTSVPTR